MRLFNRLFSIGSALGLARPAPKTYRDLARPMLTVAVDIDRYLGLWYEIARFPNRFERGCRDVTAEYGRRPDGTLSVTNRCRRGARTETARGRAEVLAPGKLAVTFVAWLPFTRGDYWVLHVAEDYSLAVVGEPSGRSGWILARRPDIAPEAWDKAISVLAAVGYDTDRLERGGQSSAP